MATITLTRNPTTEAEELGNGNLVYKWSAVGMDRSMRRRVDALAGKWFLHPSTVGLSQSFNVWRVRITCYFGFRYEGIRCDCRINLDFKPYSLVLQLMPSTSHQ